MPRACTVCSHQGREAIDRALVEGASNLSVSSLFDVSEAAVRRHRANHLPARLAKAQEAREVARADDLLEAVRGLQARALAILGRAEGAGDLRAALGAIREARGNLELLAKLQGELDDRPAVSVLMSPQWLEIRAAIVAAVEPHAEAREAVLAAARDAGGGEGREGRDGDRHGDNHPEDPHRDRRQGRDGHGRARGEADVVGEFLADPPEWWGRRAAECVRRGMPERPVNAPANATAFEVYGTSTRWSGETLPRVTERLEGGEDCEADLMGRRRHDVVAAGNTRAKKHG